MEIDRKQYFMRHAQITAEASKCTYFKVGAVIVIENRIISHGYNGTPSGFPEECYHFFNGEPEKRHLHHQFSENNTIHAEQNALLWAARKGIPVENSAIYITMYPCHNCVKMIVAAGIKEIYYLNDYDLKNPYTEEFCRKAGVLIEQIKLNQK